MYMGKSNFSGLAKIYIQVYDIIIIIFFLIPPSSKVEQGRITNIRARTPSPRTAAALAN